MKAIFFGLGSIGQRHLRLLKEMEDVKVLWVPSGQRPVSNSLVENFDLTIYSDVNEALKENPDFGVIANPTSLHVDTGCRLAEAGVPFLLEKPVSSSLEDLDKLQDCVKKSGVKVLVGYNFRYHPAYQTFKEWVSEGKIGTPISMRANFGQWLPDWHPERDYRYDHSAKKEMGGGVTLDLSHDLDLAHDLFGDVNRISAMGGHLSSLEIDTEDVMEITLAHSNQRISQLHLDYCQRVYSKKMTIIGDEGTINWDYAANEVRLLRPEEDNFVYQVPADFERDDMFRRQLDHFLAVVKGHEEPMISLEEGIYVNKLALAALQSNEEGKHVTI